MRSVLAFSLAVSFAMFGFGLSLKCYSCPDGSTSSCNVTRTCNQTDDSCLQVTAGDVTYKDCVRYTDCDNRILAIRYPNLAKFSYRCCSSNLCNGKKKTLKEKFWSLFN